MASAIQQRRDSILALLYQEGSVEVSQLSSELKVSEATIRRDLHNLANEGLLELSHGGASVVHSPDFSFMSRAMRQNDSKRVIGQLACELVEDGDQLFLDSGTTCFSMTKYLRARRGLSVIVNSTRTAQELVSPGVGIILLGGQYRSDRMDTVGPLASATLDRLRGYKAFFGSDGLGMDFGPTAIDIESASLFGLAVQHSRHAILLADDSKFDSPALYRIVDWNQVGTVVTNRKPDNNWLDFFESHDIRVKYPEQKSETQPAKIENIKAAAE